MSFCIAHIRPEPNGELVLQTASDHCRATARLAAHALSPLGLAKTAYLAGLLHDMGKFTILFGNYIRLACAGKDVRRGSVNHTFAGVRFLLERYHAPVCCSQRDVASEVIAYAVGAHHGQFDCIGPNGDSGFLHRMEKEDICYEEARDNFLDQCAGVEELDALFEATVQELGALHQRLLDASRDSAEGAFSYGLLCRLVLSAVIDGDRRDTAAFLGVPAPPDFPDDLGAVWKARLFRVEEKLDQFPRATPIDRVRRTISDQCRDFAYRGGGIYRLAVPTGAGKTLTSLRYVLAHAAEHGKRRIFFFTPLLSVTEQNAHVVRDYVGDDRLILEHHSNLVRSQGDTGALDPAELLEENWLSPIVISTLAQLLNTLFLGKPSSIRRMGALVDSVIVIDEIQSVPRHMLTQFNLALNFLSDVCGATVILCTATQPCLEALPHPIHYSSQADMVPWDPALWSPFRRTELLDRRIPGGYSIEQLACFAQDLLWEHRSLLLICNTKGQAKALYNQLRGADAGIYHLSTSMCLQHRTDTLGKITRRLSSDERVLCVSTQLVEAGIDFSFGAVVRVSAGMDNAAQAAGRCNRNGEFGLICPVYIVNIQGEDLSRLPDIRGSQVAAEELLSRFARDSAPFHDDLLSGEAIRYYYRRLFFNLKKGYVDYPLADLGSSLFDLLSTNQVFGAHAGVRREGCFYLGQAFDTAGKRFRVFEDNTMDLLVPYHAGKDLIADFCSQKAMNDLVYRRSLLERAKPYTVSLYAYQEHQLSERGGLYHINDVCTVLPEFYDPCIGVVPEGHGAVDFMEV